MPPSPHSDGDGCSSAKGFDCLKNKDYDQAIAEFSRSIFLWPTEAAYFWHKAEACVCVCDFDSAIMNFRMARDILARQGQSRPVYMSIRFSNVAFTWGQILLDHLRFREALKMFMLAQELGGVAPSSLLLRMALAHLGLEQYDEAIELLYEVTELLPTDVDVIILRAKIYKTQRNVDLVNVDLQEAIRLRPDHPEIPELFEYVMREAADLKNKASDQILKGSLVNAIYYLNHAIELDPRDWIILFRRLSAALAVVERAILFAQLGQSDNAIGDLNAALEHPELDPERTQEIRNYLGSVYNKIGVEQYQARNYEEALKNFTIGLQYNPYESMIYKNRADCYYLAGHLERTLSDNLKALELDPADIECRKRCGIVRFMMGERHFNQGTYVEAIYEFTKRIDEARQDLASLLQLHPDHTEANALYMTLTGGSPPLDGLEPFPPQKIIKPPPPKQSTKSSSKASSKIPDTTTFHAELAPARTPSSAAASTASGGPSRRTDAGARSGRPLTTASRATSEGLSSGHAVSLPVLANASSEAPSKNRGIKSQVEADAEPQTAKKPGRRRMQTQPPPVIHEKDLVFGQS
ncbi:uncharacterized protein BJ171DRAFT_565159 [Polychytrium aggregatum]|uniref:uncharacterized protein n=1 Tax=Polychytrium aggregatum TaxID=110093 RepID=UPI0022FEF849|nr:uncharacterized protein BJ171DRAFT_565159 [Polychytrium aggregatum]KAI9208677.1 hypothetical protein BJ171DRAFT_565159 [Polychytrium aggregatum]